VEQFIGGDAHEQFSQTSIVLPFTSEDRRRMILGPRPGVPRGPRHVPARHIRPALHVVTALDARAGRSGNLLWEIALFCMAPRNDSLAAN
jgi:hypothetical protein